MKWSVEKKRLLGLGFASAILIGINALAYWRVNQNKKAFDELANIRQILEQLATVSSDIKDAETGQRGYIITGEEWYLEPYVAAVPKVKPELKTLRTQTENNSHHQRRLDTLDLLTAQKFAELEQTINLRRNKGFEAAQRVVLTNRGKQIMNEIRAVIQEIEQEERHRRERTLREVQANARKDTLISTAGIVSSFILLYLVYYSFKRELKARRQAELVLQKLNVETSEALLKEQELNELKSRIITVISHEYRTPLTTILSSTEILEHYSHKLSEQKRIGHLQRIVQATNHLTELVGDMLDISQAEAGELGFNPASLDLESFCRQLVEELQNSDASEHSIAFVKLGDCSSCVADERLLRQILANLLSNAAKYSPKNSTIYFELRCQEGEGTVVFQVRDEGIGIPESDRARLFQPFERGSNVGTVSGTGLGLAITKKLVDLHDGAISVDSAINIGTTFTVTLPQNRKLQALMENRLKVEKWVEG